MRIQAINHEAATAPLQGIFNTAPLKHLLTHHNITTPSVEYSLTQRQLSHSEPNTSNLLRAPQFDVTKWLNSSHDQRVRDNCTCRQLLADPRNTHRHGLPNDFPAIPEARGHYYSNDCSPLGDYAKLLRLDGDFRPPTTQTSVPEALAAIDHALEDWAHRVIGPAHPGHLAILHTARQAARAAMAKRPPNPNPATEAPFQHHTHIAIRRDRRKFRPLVAILLVDKATKKFIFACPFVLRTLVVKIMTGGGYVLLPTTTTLQDVTAALTVAIAHTLQPLSPDTVRNISVSNCVGEFKASCKVEKGGTLRPIINNSQDILAEPARHLHALLVIVLAILPTLSETLGFNVSWATTSSLDWLRSIPSHATSFATADIKQMFDKCAHDSVMHSVTILSHLAFRIHAGHGLAIVTKDNKPTAEWRPLGCLNPQSRASHYDCPKVLRLCQLILTNAHVLVGGRLWRQIIGVPMGSQASSDISEAAVACPELIYMLNLPAAQRPLFRHVRRRADDTAAFGFTPDALQRALDPIYPDPLEPLVSRPGGTGLNDDFLDVTVTIDPTTNAVSTRHFCKTDTFPFPVDKGPQLGGATPTAWAHSTMFSKFITLYRASSSREDFARSVHKTILYLTTVRHYNRFKLRKVYARFASRLHTRNRYNAPINLRTLSRIARAKPAA